MHSSSEIRSLDLAISTATSPAPSIIGIYDPNRTGNAYIDGVMSGYKWPPGTTIHYGFPTTITPYASPYGGSTADTEYNKNFVPVSQFTQETFDAFITGVRSGSVHAMTLTPIMGFTNLTLVKDAAPTADTHMLIATSSQPSTAWAYYPGEKFGNREGDVWLGQNYDEYITPANGSYGSYIMLHEFGHALGLKHSFDLHEQEDVHVPFNEDFWEYTIMSYSGAPYVTPTDEVSGPESGFSYGHPQTFMMLDIAALQEMYGANYTFRDEGNTYSWSPTTGEVFVDGISQGREGATDATGTFVKNNIFQTIWDGGGIDTYDLSNYSTNLVLDLAPGGYSTFSDGQRSTYGYFPYPTQWYARGNVYNALLHDSDTRSLIENAKGGSGNDRLSGNIGVNHLWGNAGKDTFSGGAGDDVLNGGDGIDTAVFSGSKTDYTITKNADGSFTIADNRDACDGTDTLTSINFAQFSDQFYMLADPSFTRTGSAKSERINGDIGNDNLYGLGGNDVLNGYVGADYMSGGAGGDLYYVDDVRDQTIELSTSGGIDRVYTTVSRTLGSNVENLTAIGRDSISLAGNGLSNTILGNAGNNKINGGLGIDILKGGVGSDTFVFNTAPSAKNVDRVLDFNITDDSIQLENAVFKKLGSGFSASPKVLDHRFFAIDKARDSNDYIIHDRAKGTLSYDADGSGSAQAIAFATVQKNLLLTYKDFYIV
ncbi:MAG TPA: M10 family metallopeptidase C-terminal domain-containing protein [Microvirga sp.]|nr:M10 family metallopeptidase C-terminal domain-containing protein [Microvirga sp.]